MLSTFFNMCSICGAVRAGDFIQNGLQYMQLWKNWQVPYTRHGNTRMDRKGMYAVCKYCICKCLYTVMRLRPSVKILPLLKQKFFRQRRRSIQQVLDILGSLYRFVSRLFFLQSAELADYRKWKLGVPMTLHPITSVSSIRYYSMQ